MLCSIIPCDLAEYLLYCKNVTCCCHYCHVFSTSASVYHSCFIPILPEPLSFPAPHSNDFDIHSVLAAKTLAATS